MITRRGLLGRLLGGLAIGATHAFAGRRPQQLASVADAIELQAPWNDQVEAYDWSGCRTDYARCPFRFKDAACGYSGAATTCDKTFGACQARGNQMRFGGMPAARRSEFQCVMQTWRAGERINRGQVLWGHPDGTATTKTTSHWLGIANGDAEAGAEVEVIVAGYYDFGGKPIHTECRRVHPSCAGDRVVLQ